MINEEVVKDGEVVRRIEIEHLGGGNVEYRRYEPPGNLVEQRDATDEETERLRAKLRVDRQEEVRSAAEQAISDLETIAGSSGDLTQTQLSNAVRRLASVLAKLIRFVLRKLDISL